MERPLRAEQGGPAVKYRSRLWRVSAGAIDLDSLPLDDPAAAPGAAQPCPGIPVQDASPVTADQPDDSAERSAIIEAPASARMLVEAGPGTGKTHMAALRLSRLISAELSPGQVLVLSFSRSAVRTLTRRLADVARADERLVEELRHVSIRTFDSWTFRILRLLGEQPAELLRRTHADSIAALTAAIRGPNRALIRQLIGDRRHLIIDEFQDLPGVRGDLVLALLDLLCPPGQPGCGFSILGDPAQAIYGFAAKGDLDRVWPSPQEYWRTVQGTYGAELAVRALTRNYRATAPLAALSTELRTLLLGALPAEEKLRLIRERVAALPAPASTLDPSWLAVRSGSQAILTRSNGEALRVLQKLVGFDDAGPATPVRLRAGSFAGLPPAWIGALLRQVRSLTVARSQFDAIHAHLAALWGADVCRQLGLPEVDVAWMRLASASGAAEDATVLDVADLRARLGWPDAFPDDQPLFDDGLIVTTIHQSKGMEFDVVTVLESTRTPDEDDEDVDQDASSAEEASVAYVGITRAARDLRSLSGSTLHRAPASQDFGGGRSRLRYWWNGRVQLEMGLRGDVDPIGFVAPDIHGGGEGVQALQQYLLENALALEGHKVVLCREFVDGKALFAIHLQENLEPGRLIGRTAHQLTYDLLSLLHKRGYSLPGRIHNLRIAGVGTVTSDQDVILAEPDQTSRLWLGVSLFGTGDFSPKKKAAS